MTPEQERLVLDHRNLIGAALKSLGWMLQYPDRDGLQGAGNLALVEAAIRYDPTLGVPFHKWAFIRIRGAIIDEARRGRFGPRRIQDEAIAVSHARAEFAQAGRTDPTVTELAAHLIWAVSRVEQALAEAEQTTVASLDALLANAGVEPADPDTPDDAYARAETIREVRAAIAALPARHREVVIAYYLHGRDQGDIAADQGGVTASRVSQLLAIARRCMRDQLTAAQPSAA